VQGFALFTTFGLSENAVIMTVILKLIGHGFSTLARSFILTDVAVAFVEVCYAVNYNITSTGLNITTR
jgi:hypothetical protein